MRSEELGAGGFRSWQGGTTSCIAGQALGWRPPSGALLELPKNKIDRKATLTCWIAAVSAATKNPLDGKAVKLAPEGGSHPGGVFS